MAKEETKSPQVEVPPEENATTPEVTEMKNRLEKAEQQNIELLRTLAEFQNTRKREARDLEIERKFSHSKLANDLLPALDNLERALGAARQAGDKSPLVMGVMATQMQILDILRRHGITPIEAQGQSFDANFHQAVTTRQTADIPANHVLEVLQKGFMIHDRVLRPASVVVAQMPTVPVEKNGGE
ncbi:nucleotide exchange factor GrpE [Telmatocola sphagniphila]|jgi:molecular chaperone GrpE|uniref:Protein GrpE n=1 Tax=Telmatocola sphagniphila TaxID=1123043 RepID=A0A8E6EVD1_9BACT|nr:nucleotide exchange factor GrpE [Telmatocola sphagniphila]QVL32560.1 nucleotide exchange factor GrpE [Telmatocola sphagniphila]